MLKIQVNPVFADGWIWIQDSGDESNRSSNCVTTTAQHKHLFIGEFNCFYHSQLESVVVA